MIRICSMWGERIFMIAFTPTVFPVFEGPNRVIDVLRTCSDCSFISVISRPSAAVRTSIGRAGSAGGTRI